MKQSEYLTALGHQICAALNEGDSELRGEHKFNLLEQIEALIEMSKVKDHLLLTTAVFIDQATKGEAEELTSALRSIVFD